MGTTKVAPLVRVPDMVNDNDIAHGHVGENKFNSRIFGSSSRGDYIFTVR
jgi:hypothetical protein